MIRNQFSYPQTPLYDSYTGEVVDEFDVTLGENQFWMMGDNRLGSYDSRGFGPVESKMIHGKILFEFGLLIVMKDGGFSTLLSIQ